MNWYFEVLKKYAVFSGRAQRKEYWLFMLCNFLIGLVLSLIALIGPVLSLVGIAPPFLGWLAGGISVVAGLYSLGVLIPGLAVTVRRLHDTNRSGGCVFLALIPLVGAIILLVFLVQDSDLNENQYGPNPKTTAE